MGYKCCFVRLGKDLAPKVSRVEQSCALWWKTVNVLSVVWSLSSASNLKNAFKISNHKSNVYNLLIIYSLHFKPTFTLYSLYCSLASDTTLGLSTRMDKSTNETTSLWTWRVAQSSQKAERQPCVPPCCLRLGHWPAQAWLQQCLPCVQQRT